ncbi:hypothetical protein KaCgl_09960 [Corynebacterium glutamicum]|nr:hypothetical protein KaCgl_09960 [Corynebacterium glutamicum]
MTPTLDFYKRKKGLCGIISFILGVFTWFVTPYPHHFPLSAENFWLDIKTMLAGVSIGISEGQNEPSQVLGSSPGHTIFYEGQ